MRRHSGNTLYWFIGAQIIIGIFAIWFNLWVIPSAITSGVKAVSDKCEHTYPVEKVWSGDWFCSEEK